HRENGYTTGPIHHCTDKGIQELTQTTVWNHLVFINSHKEGGNFAGQADALQRRSKLKLTTVTWKTDKKSLKHQLGVVLEENSKQQPPCKRCNTRHVLLLG